MCLRSIMPSVMPCLLCVVLLPAVAYAGNESVSIYPPAPPIRGPMGVVGYEVTGDVDSCGIQCERLWITGDGPGGNTYFDHVSFDPPDPNYGYRMFIYPPEDVDQGGVTITVTVCFGNGVEVSDTVDATVDVRIVYNLWDTYMGGGLHVEVWTGWYPYYEESILFTGERPIAPLTTQGSSHFGGEGLPCSHNDPPWGHLFCIDGDTPPCQPWDAQDPTMAPTAFAMGDCLTEDGGEPPSGEWPHAAGNGHLDLPGTVTYALNPQQRNMGHYFITCPEITAPCGCLRGENGTIGIHGGGHLTTNGQEDVAKEMAVSQEITPTWGCIRIHNGCPICAQNHALQALGDYHKRMQETHHHPIYLFVPYLPGP